MKGKDVVHEERCICPRPPLGIRRPTERNQALPNEDVCNSEQRMLGEETSSHREESGRRDGIVSHSVFTLHPELRTSAGD